MVCGAPSQAVEPSIPAECAGQLDQPEVVDVLLVVSNQDSSALRQPAQSVRSTTHRRGLCPLDRLHVLLLLADQPNVWACTWHRPPPSDLSGCHTPCRDKGVAGAWPWVSVVSTTMASIVARSILQSGTFAPSMTSAQRPTFAVNQHGLLGAVFPTIRRVFPHLFPPEPSLTQPAVGGLPFPLHAPSSSHSLTSSSQIVSSRRRHTSAGTSHGRCSWGRTCGATDPTGNRTASGR